MPQLLFIAAIGVIAYYGYQAVTKEMGRVSDKLKDAEEKREYKVVGELEQDPETGKYKPKKKDDA